jgi:hypothetical protein
MGHILKAKCTNCDFEQKVYFGASRANFRTHSNVPAIKISTGEFVMENYLTEKDNADLIFYNSEELNSLREGKTYSWNDIRLYEKGNKCPKCQKYTLEFIRIGLFD